MALPGDEKAHLAIPESIDNSCSKSITLEVPNATSHQNGIKKSHSMASITSAVREKFRKRRQQFKRNQCAGIITFLILGTFLNVVAYLASVWSAQLQHEVVKSAVENEHAVKFKLKKSFYYLYCKMEFYSDLAEAPSKYLIGLLNFSGRVASALGIVLLVQVVASYMKRRRYNALVRSGAEEADTLIGDMHSEVTDSVGECCLNCFQAFY